MPPTAPDAITPAASTSSPTAPPAITAAGAGSTPAAPGATTPVAWAEMANRTIRFNTTGSFTTPGGTLSYSEEPIDFVGDNRWETGGKSIYWVGGYWYCRLYSNLLDEVTIILRAAGAIDVDPSALTYAHYNSINATGGAWTLTAVAGTYTAPPTAITAAASAVAPSAPAAIAP